MPKNVSSSSSKRLRPLRSEHDQGGWLTPSGLQIQREAKTLAEDENWYLESSGVKDNIERKEKWIFDGLMDEGCGLLWAAVLKDSHMDSRVI